LFLKEHKMDNYSFKNIFVITGLECQKFMEYFITYKISSKLLSLSIKSKIKKGGEKDGREGKRLSLRDGIR